MSVINKKPLIEKVVSALSPEQKKNLLKGLNGELTKSVKVFDNLSTSDKGISYVDIKFVDGVKTGYLVYNDAVSVLIAYYNDTQKMTLFVLDVTKHTYKASREYLTIDELRRIVGLELVEVGENIKIQVGDIDSGSQTANKIIVSDGEGGASWGSVIEAIENSGVEDGSAQYLIGIDSNGDVVKDEIPEGIVVDQTIVEDSTNAVSGGAVYDALELKANSSDVYTKTAADELLDEKASITALENGTVVPAKALVSEQLENVSEDSGTIQDAPSVFQATATDGGAGASDTAPIAKYLKLKGRTYALNQLVTGITNLGTSNSTYSYDSTSKIGTMLASAQNGQVSYSFTNLVSGHKYIVKVEVKLTTATTSVRLLGNIGSAVSQYTKSTTEWQLLSVIVEATGNNGSLIIRDGRSSDWDNIQIRFLQLIDLTQLVNGDTDYLNLFVNGVILSDYNLTFTGVDIFNQLFPLPYYAFNEGTLVSANATLLTTIGKNQFDGVLRQGDTRIGNTNAKVISSVNPIKVIPGQTYRIEITGFSSLSQDGVFVIEYASLDDITNNNILKATNHNAPFNVSLQSNTHYVLLQFNFSVNTTPTSSNVGKACFFLAWLENGTTSRPGFEEYVKHEYPLGDELATSPLLSAGNVCDEKTPDGVITRRIGVVDLSQLSPSYNSSAQAWQYSVLSGIKAPSGWNDLANAISDKFLQIDINHGYNQNVVGYFYINPSGVLYINNGSTTTAPTGTLYYELATPTTTQGTPFPAIVEVDDMGTMGYGGTSYNGYPQGCEFFYPADYVLFIDSLGNTCDFDASKIALKSDVSTEETARTNYDTQLLNAIGGTLRQLLASSQSIDFNDTDWVDLGTLTYAYSSAREVFSASITGSAGATGSSIAKALSTKYKTVSGNTAYNGYVGGNDKCFGIFENGTIYIVDSAYSDATAFKTAMKGVLLAYEKASS